MRTSLAIATFVAMCWSSALAETAHRAKILNIEGQAQQTPEFQISGPKDKPTKPRYWIEIEAEVEVETTDSNDLRSPLLKRRPSGGRHGRIKASKD